MLSDMDIKEVVKQILQFQDVDYLTIRAALAISAVEEPRVVENYRNALIIQCIEELSACDNINVSTPATDAAEKRKGLLNLIDDAHAVFQKINQHAAFNPSYSSFVEATLNQLSALSPFTERAITNDDSETKINQLMSAFTSGLAQLPQFEIIKALHICKDYLQAAEANIVYLGAIEKTGHRATTYANLLYNTVLESTNPAIQDALTSMSEAVQRYAHENGFSSESSLR